MDLHAEVAEVKESIKHHRIAVFAIVTFLILLTIAVNVVLRSTNIPQTTKTSAQPTQKQEVTVPLNTDYQNPFDKNTQYVNPFSQYKNPFDTLK
ncbi:hypothetical protein HY612_02750 [Candidatus Roizmanbacteria bacterium]|nr:hypothetical protein [Candidatus Roizmanbacteria bacterium]